MKRISAAQSRARILPIAREFAVISLFVVAAIVMTWPLLPHARTHIVDVGVDDTLLYARYARCFRDWLIGREHGYLSFDMYFPSLLSGATDDAALGISVQALPLAIFIRDYLFTINLITFASFVMCAHATYLLTRELTSSRGAGIVAGFAFAFCFYRIRQLDHPHMMQTQWLPYALYFMHRLAKAPTRKNAIAFALAGFAAMTASFDVAIYSSLVFPVVGLWLVLTTRQRRMRLALCFVAAGALVSAPLYFVYRPFLILRDAGAPVRDMMEILQFSSSLQDFWQTPTRLFNPITRSDVRPESIMFLGWSVLGLAAVGVFGMWPKSRRALVSREIRWTYFVFALARAAALAVGLVAAAAYAVYVRRLSMIFAYGVPSLAIVMVAYRVSRFSRAPISAAPVYAALAIYYAAVSLGPFVVNHNLLVSQGVWRTLQLLPGFDQIRTPSRFYFVTSLCAAVCAGFGAKALSASVPWPAMRSVIFGALSCAVLFELAKGTGTIPLRKMPTVATAPPIYQALADALKPGAVIEFPVEWTQQQRKPVYFANIFQRPTVNGMSSWGMFYFNGSEMESWQRLSATNGDSLGFDTLRAEHIAGLRYVVMHRSRIFRQLLASYVTAVDTLGGHFIASYGDDALYELPDPPPSRPPRAEDIDVSLQKIEWRSIPTREIFVAVMFVNRTPENLYAPNRIQHFALSAHDSGDLIGEGNGYLAPPLFTPHGNFTIRFRMKLRSGPLPRFVDVAITDDEKKVWGQQRLEIPD